MRFKLLAWLLCSSALVACGDDLAPTADASDGLRDGGADAEIPDGSAGSALFERPQPLEVVIEIAEADWDVLRKEGRSLAQTFAGFCETEFAYTWVDATVEIDGEVTEEVAVRKKGFIGSLSVYRPSLRLDFGRDTHEGRTFHGARRITLNNNRADRSNVRQCVTFELFEQAGIVAPRCGLAHVTVNGEDKGFFTNVEPIDKAMLARTFGDDEGNLYELAKADFTAGLVDRFELKTNETENDRSDLDAVMRALEAPDDELLEALDEVFDLDELITFWAMEVLVGHWDGMTGNQNNSYLYLDPQDGRFHPIPWGTDNALQATHRLIAGVPPSVYAFNTWSERLYAIPEARRMYQDRLRELMAVVWDEERILERIGELAELTQADPVERAEVEELVRGRRRAIEDDLARNGGTGPELILGVTDTEVVCQPPRPASSAIDFTWTGGATMFDVLPSGTLELDVPLDDGRVEWLPGTILQAVGFNDEGSIQIGAFGADRSSGALLWVGLFMAPQAYEAGTIEFHGVETFAAIVRVDTAEPQVMAVVSDGSATLTEAGMELDAPVIGSWQGMITRRPDGERRATAE